MKEWFQFVNVTGGRPRIYPPIIKVDFKISGVYTKNIYDSKR
jgi:hypothetical protein